MYTCLSVWFTVFKLIAPYNVRLFSNSINLFDSFSQLFSTKKSNPDKPSVKIKEDEVLPTCVGKMSLKGPFTIPKKVPYLIVGGGAASWSALKAIKEHVPNAKVFFSST